MWQAFSSTKAEDLNAAGQTVGIACGDHKAKAIVGAQRTKLLNTLITDEYTARNFLECSR